MPAVSPGILCVDRIAPTGSFTSPASGNVAGTISVSVTAADNDQVASVQFRIDGVNIGAADTVAPFSTTYDTRSLTNGNHTFSAIITDRIGNQTVINQLVNFANAPVVTITSPANASTVSGPFNFLATVSHYDASCSTQFYIDGGLYGSAQAGAGGLGYGGVESRSLQNGVHRLGVISTDGHGNQTYVYVDVTYNNVPLVSITAPTNAANVSGVIDFLANVTSYDATISSQFKIDGANYGAAQSGAGLKGAYGWVDTRSLLNGFHTYSVTVTDGHGNTVSASVSANHVNAPIATITSPGANATVSGTNTLFNATVTSYDATVSTQFYIDGGAYGAAQSGAGVKGYAFNTQSWLNGWHTFTVISTDGHGNTGRQDISVYHRNAPLVTITSPGSGATVAGVVAFTASVTSYDASVSTQFKVDGGNYGSALSGAGSKSFASLDTRGWLNGWHTYSVLTTDGSGNTATASFSVYHRNFPTITIHGPGSGATLYDIIWFYSTTTHYSSSISVMYQVDGSNWQSSANTYSQFQYDTHYLGVGWHRWTVRSTDAEGNVTTVYNDAYVNNQVPGAGYTMFGNKMTWWGAEGEEGWYEQRSSPGGDPWGGGYWWSNLGEGAGAHPYIQLPGNPDINHYQMWAKWRGDYVEGGSDGNVVHLCFTFFGVDPGYEFFRNGDTGIQLGVNGGEWFTVTHWQDWENNTCHTAGVGVYYFFSPKMAS